MMQVSTSRFYERAAQSMGRLSNRADALNTQIATEKRLQRPSDDAVAYRRLQGLRQVETDDGTYGTNLKLAGSVLAQADSVLGEVGDQLQHASELALRAANGTLNAGDRKVIGLELASIAEALVGLVNKTDPRGLPLFGDAAGGAAAVRRPDGGYTLAETSPSSIPVAEGQALQAGEPAARAFGFAGKDGPTDVIAVVAGLAAALQGGTDPSAALATGVKDLKLASDQTTAVQASLGARAARVDMLTAQAIATAANREEVRSGLEDADITATITELQKTMTILSATQASFSKLSSLSLFDYLR